MFREHKVHGTFISSRLVHFEFPSTEKNIFYLIIFIDTNSYTMLKHNVQSLSHKPKVLNVFPLCRWCNSAPKHGVYAKVIAYFVLTLCASWC
jgi:hypothetical protein